MLFASSSPWLASSSLCPLHMHIKYLVNLTYNYEIAAILKTFFDGVYCPYSWSWRLHIASTYLSLLYQHTQCATVAYFPKFMSIFLNSFILFTSHLNFMCFDIWASKTILVKYVPKCQMSLGTYGPIFEIFK